jgi:hypothetical protein
VLYSAANGSSSFSTIDQGVGVNLQGIYSINGGAFVPFFANSDSGDLTLVIDQPEVDQIQFQAPRFVDDYALNSVDLTAVPEPASMILLGTGLLLAARRRYQMKRQQ